MAIKIYEFIGYGKMKYGCFKKRYAI